MSTTILATVTAKPTATANVAAALQAMIAPSRSEPGCLQYALFASRDTPGTFYLLERYADDAALAAHQTSPHFTALVAGLADKLVRKIHIEQIQCL